MSEPIWCCVNIHTPGSWWPDPEQPDPDFIEALHRELINGDVQCDTLDDGSLVFQVAGEGNYGLNDSCVEPIIDWLQEQRVPYVAYVDAKYEWTGEVHVFDGVEHWQDEYTESGPVLNGYTYRRIMSGEDPRFASVDEFFARFSMTAEQLDISHLPAEAPTMTEDE